MSYSLVNLIKWAAMAKVSNEDESRTSKQIFSCIPKKAFSLKKASVIRHILKKNLQKPEIERSSKIVRGEILLHKLWGKKYIFS